MLKKHIGVCVLSPEAALSDTQNTTIWGGVGPAFGDITNLQSGPLVIGYNLPAFVRREVNPRDYTQYFQNHALDAIAKNGVFAQLAPPYLIDGGIYTGDYAQWGDGYIHIGTGVRESRDYSIGEKDVDLHFQTSTKDFVDRYNQFLSLAALNQRSKVDLSQNSENNTFILGATSNVDLSLGSGNNVIMTSPNMASFVNRVWVDDKGHGLFDPYYITKIYSNIFYPSSQGALRSNTLELGHGNNLIYYDNSYRNIKTGDGDNIFVPSFGSFNWATNDLQAGTRIGDSYNVQPSKRTLLTPIPVSAGEGGLYSVDDLYTSVLNIKTYGTTGRAGSTGKENAFQMYYGNKATSLNNEDNIVGGVRIVGGRGNDTFYGMDPDFYSSIMSRTLKMDTVKSNGSGLNYDQLFPASRSVFDSLQDVKNGRLSLQNFETIELLGGGGNNIFYLGNPTHLAADGSKYTGRFSYKISSSHDRFGNDADRADLMWGNNSPSVSSINVNLSANVETYTLSSSSFDQKQGKDAPVLDTVKTGTSIANTTNKFFDKIMEKGKVWKFIPYADFAISAASAVVDTIKTIKSWIGVAPDPEPIILNETQFKQPLGSWKQAINIDDWNPNLVLNISVDPTATTNKDLRWGNIAFKINPPDSSSEGVYGVTISQQQGGETPRDLFRLEGLGTSQSSVVADFGYYSYDFRKGQYRLINEADLAFFGQIANGIKDINPLSNYVAKNGFVFSSTDPAIASAYGNNTYSFYWNDAGRDPVTGLDHNEKWLQDARNASSQLSIKFDSRKFGWFWDPKLIADPEQGPEAFTIDKDQSRLWVELQTGKWKPFSWTDLEQQPMSYSYALRAKTFYQVGQKGVLISPEDQITAERIIESLTLLNELLPSLTILGARDLASKTYLSAVDQITFVDKGVYTAPVSPFNPNPKTNEGQWIYYLHDDKNPSTSNVFKAFIYHDDISNRTELGVTSNSNFKQVLSYSELYTTEKSNNVDINLDGAIGEPAMAAVLASHGLTMERDLLPGVSENPYSLEDMVTAFYRGILKRDAESSEISSWVNAIQQKVMARDDVMEAFLDSQEFFTNKASLDEFVTDLYVNLLLREPDEAGLIAWRRALEDGLDADNVVDGFVSSQEFISLIGLVQQV